MLRKIGAALAFMTMLASSASAKNPQSEAKTAVHEVAKKIDAAKLKSIEYTANGYYHHFLQGYLDPSASDPGPWPKFYATYSRIIDFGKDISREQIVWTQYSNPPRGGGYQPTYHPGTMVLTTSNKVGWNALHNGGVVAGGEPVLTPQGFVQAAESGNPTLKQTTVGGQTFRIISLQLQGPFNIKIDAYVDKQNLIDKIDTWMPSIIVGDILIENRYADYRDFNGIQFPTRIMRTQDGTPTLELNVTSVNTNTPVDVQPPREPQPVRVKTSKIAAGVWFIDGPLVSSAVIEFKHYIVLVESSTSEGHALANIAAAKRIFPNKPIRYNINSHYHGDHAGGLRTFVAEGATIISSASNKYFYEHVVLKAPFKLEPDLLALHPRPAKFIWVADKYVLSDGQRKLEIYKAKGNGHCEDMLITYLPGDKLLFETDLLDDVDPASLKAGVRYPNIPPQGIVNPYTRSLWENIQRLHLDVREIVLCHGHGPVSIDALKRRLMGKVENAPIKPLY